MSFDYFFFREEFKTGNDLAIKLLYNIFNIPIYLLLEI